MDKATFLAVLTDIVAGFEDPVFQESFSAARSAGDVEKLIGLPLAVQTRAFGNHGVDAVTGTTVFKAAGKQFGLEPEVAPLLARMKAAL